MIDPKEYVSNARGQGMSDNAIRSALLSMGFPASDIGDAMGVSSAASSLSQSTPVVASTLPVTEAPVIATPEIQPTAETPTIETFVPSQNSRFALFSFHGRIGRLRYFLISTTVSVISVTVNWFLYYHVFFGAALSSQFMLVIGTFLFQFILGTLAFIIGLSLTVRRLHDLNKSGWCFFALLIPLYDFYLMVLLLFRRGTIGENKYGSDPKPPTDPETDLCDRASRNPLATISIIFISLALYAVGFYILLHIILQYSAKDIRQSAMTGEDEKMLAEMATSTTAKAWNGQTWKSYFYSPSINDNFTGFSFSYPNMGSGGSMSIVTSSETLSVTAGVDNPIGGHSYGTVSVIDANGKNLDQIINVNQPNKSYMSETELIATSSITTQNGLVGEVGVFDSIVHDLVTGPNLQERIVIPLPRRDENSPQSVVMFADDAPINNSNLIALIAETVTVGKKNIASSAPTNISKQTASSQSNNIGLSTSGWRSYVMNKPSPWSILDTITPPVCYTVKYPSALIAHKTGNPNVVWFENPSTSDNNGVTKGGVTVTPAINFGTTTTLDSVMENYTSLFFDPQTMEVNFGKVQNGILLTKFTTAGELAGEMVMPQNGDWSIYVELHEAVGNVILRLATPYGITYDAETAEAMAESIVPTCQ